MNIKIIKNHDGTRLFWVSSEHLKKLPKKGSITEEERRKIILNIKLQKIKSIGV